MSFEWSFLQIVFLASAELLLLVLWFARRRARVAAVVAVAAPPARVESAVVSDDPADWFVLDADTRRLFDQVMVGADGWPSFSPRSPARSFAVGTAGDAEIRVRPISHAITDVVAMYGRARAGDEALQN